MAVAFSAVAGLVLVAQVPGTGMALAGPLDFSALVVLILLAMLLEGLSTPIVTASGERVVSSVSSIPHLALVPLFGPVVASIGNAAAYAGAGLFIRRVPITKVIFNVSQLALATSAAGLAYVLLGGPVSTSSIGFEVRTVLAFTASAGTYFLVNSVLVTAVVALDSSDSFRRTWPFVTTGALPGDLAAAFLALVLAILYAKLNLLGVLALLLPLLFLHHANQVNIKLHQLNRDLLRLIVKTIEAKDPYTSGHSLRVAQLSRRVSEEMKLSRKTIETIETAALLHDFGKIDMAYGHIISHAGPLTARQRDVIRSHPSRGAELLASISTLDKQILEAVRHHHEHFDGSGYPDGVAGEQIPLAARIIMVADTIDAMLSARPYRPALSPSVVEEELRGYSGRQFDPAVVNAVIRSGVLRTLAPETITAPIAETEVRGPSEAPSEAVSPQMRAG